MSSSQSINQQSSVTGGQKFGLLFMSSVALALALYSCYLHHVMTNLLLKSLSSGLMTKKRHSRRPSKGRNAYNSNHRRKGKESRKSRRVVEESFSDDYSQSTDDDLSTYA